MATKKSRAANSKRLLKLAPGVYSDDPRDLREAREWARRGATGRRKKPE